MRTVLGLCALLLVLTGCGTPRSADRRADLPDWQLAAAPEIAGPGHIIVTVALADRESLTALARRLEAEHSLVMAAEWPLHAINAHCLVFRTDQPDAIETTIASLGADPQVHHAQPMHQFQTLARAYSDELFGLQTGLQAMNIPLAHEIATGRGVQLALIDTLPDRRHPDLAGRIARVQDFVRFPGDPASAEVHGTAMAGIIAADGENGQGIVGVAPAVELWALRGCWQEPGLGPGRCSSFSIARALNYALLNDADIINLSLGGPRDPLVAELVIAAIDKGVAVVAADTGRAETAFPASEPGVIPVRAGTIAAVVSPAAGATLAAPGTDILSTAPDARYDFFSGSSVAAAHVAGVVALMLEVDTGLTPATIRETLALSASRAVAGPLGAELDACLAIAGVMSGSGGLDCSCTDTNK